MQFPINKETRTEYPVRVPLNHAINLILDFKYSGNDTKIQNK